ncbi:relaxase/mobilization nuclease domain-containing protein [Roseovarius aquimarinus]|uniref:Relaxase/mobilization nuclease domain-containing protein n=1 Tax=Roseovarius aquimarinus TaxID=1229156 RepID=A0ABW7IBY9_9RHOB
MICKIIGKEGEKGTGGDRDAFAPGILYICGKAKKVVCRNLSTSRWQDAADEMVLTTELSERVQKPYYHLVLSWHDQERVGDDAMLFAMTRLLRALGLAEHQAVIGTHHDAGRLHVHAITNVVHPLTGRVWSKSNDMQKAELACRQMELDNGWPHDRGRFDFDVIEKNGRRIARLKTSPEIWEKKKIQRAAGKRAKSSGDMKFEKSTGFETFEHGIPDPLRKKFAVLVRNASSWDELHIALGGYGLTYCKSGSGARVRIIGSSEHAKASAFGSRFSISNMEAAFGPFREPETSHLLAPRRDHVEVAALIGTMSEASAKASKASAFKLTLLRRVYTDIHIDARVAEAIRFVALADKPPRITFADGSSIVDYGSRLSTSRSTQETRPTLIAMAKAKGWTSVRPLGSPEFVRRMALECARAGLRVAGVPSEVQVIADEMWEEARRAQTPLARATATMQQHHLVGLVGRGEKIAENKRVRAWKAQLASSIRMHAKAIQDDVGGGDGPTKSRRMKLEERDTRLRSLPDMRTVSNPQPAPDTASMDKRGHRRIARQLRANDHAEIEEMKRVDIGFIAGMGGWSDVSRTHPDSSDRHGAKFRIFQRGGDTLKASLVEDKWLWTSNKSGQSGSVIDLWLCDNPGRNLGHARAAFREIMGGTFGPVASAPDTLSDIRGDHTDARRRWEEARYIEDRRSYAEARGIDRKTLLRFRNDVRAGAFGGIYFAHRNPVSGDIQGFEQRWERNGEKNAARFAKGGHKSANVLGDLASATRMVVLESGLDALALAEMEERHDTIYVSTGGGFGPRSVAALRAYGTGKTVLSGFDNDAAGDLLADKLRALFPASERLAPPSRIEGARQTCKDWLDVLGASKSVGTGPEKMKTEYTGSSAMENDGSFVSEEPPSQPLPSTDSGPSFW